MEHTLHGDQLSCVLSLGAEAICTWHTGDSEKLRLATPLESWSGKCWPEPDSNCCFIDLLSRGTCHVSFGRENAQSVRVGRVCDPLNHCFAPGSPKLTSRCAPFVYIQGLPPTADPAAGESSRSRTKPKKNRTTASPSITTKAQHQV